MAGGKGCYCSRYREVGVSGEWSLRSIPLQLDDIQPHSSLSGTQGPDLHILDLFPGVVVEIEGVRGC